MDSLASLGAALHEGTAQVGGSLPRATALCHCPSPAGRHYSLRGGDAQVHLDAQPQPSLWDK